MGWVAKTQGTKWSLCIMSAMRNSSFRPSVPPGCEKAKSSALKPRASRSAIAIASPRTSVTVVLVVGARFSGHASRVTPMSRLAVAACASVDRGSPVMLISGMPKRLISGSKVMISDVFPELEIAMTTSSRVIMPRSPWLASPGCTKNAVVPVLANVAAILLAIWPDFPIPVTTTRPLQARMRSHALSK